MNRKRARTPKEWIINRISKTEQWVYMRSRDGVDALETRSVGWPLSIAIDDGITDPVTQASVLVFEPVRERLMRANDVQNN